MTLRHGRNAQIYVNGINISGELNSIETTSEQELANITVFGNLGTTLYPGLAKDRGTIEALYNSTAATIWQNLRQTDPGYGMMIAFGTILGDCAYATKECDLISNNMRSVVTDINRATIGFDTDNYPFEPGIMLTAGIQSVAAASTGQGTQVDNNSASGTTGGAAYLQVFTVTGGTLTCSVQTSSTGAWGGEQATTATFTAASSSETQRVAINSQIYRYARAAWVNSGSTAQFALILVRY